MSIDIDTILSGTNTTYLLNLLKQYQDDPTAIEPDWVPILEDLLSQGFGDESQPGWGDILQKTDSYAYKPKLDEYVQSEKQTSLQDLSDAARVLFLIRSYRVRGHLLAALDPLEIQGATGHPDLDPRTYGFKDQDFHRPLFVNGAFGHDFMTLHDLLTKLKKVYCKNITVEYMHIQELKEREWMQERLENQSIEYDKDFQVRLLEQLTKAEFFEKFIHTKFPGAKRFGLDGGESFISALLYMIDLKAKSGTCEIVFGMAHRGRLSTLANVLNKPARSIFSQFEGMTHLPDDITASSDVKYHLGYSSDIKVNDKNVHLSLLANPSHLEAVDPLVLGKVRAKQKLLKDRERKKVVGVMIHGDAAFAGQGIIAETLGMCALKGYETGGTIHIIINNQIGFTTSPPSSRSCPYSSDVAKFIQAPIFHVNGDDPESVMRVIQIACAYHDEFKHDIVIDLVCYRRYGHNEGDEPKFTQPIMYEKIAQHPTVRKLYEQHLESLGVLTTEETQTIRDNVDFFLKDEYAAVQNAKKSDQNIALKADWMEGQWRGIKVQSDTKELLKPIKTGVDLQTLRAIGLKGLKAPKDFDLNSKIARQWNQRCDDLNKGEGIDWALAERLAFSACLIEKHPVRLSGQDCERGTFSQRHITVIDQTTEDKFIGPNNIQKDQEFISVYNSPLAEFSVLGYEYGYSSADPNSLVLWEAQFGDFANGAQVIVDQFISSAEEKWLRLSGLVMLLPHGYEGQGPEHSSARPERYLQLCAENNMIVANCSTPANYFHILRRQVKAPYRKPLVLMTPKSLLRHKLCVSDLKEMGGDSYFKPIIEDNLPAATIKKIIVCSGKVYYDLLEYRQKHNIENVAIIRLEQYYPFPKEELINALKRYESIPVIWCQEEPENMGAWTFLDRRLENVLTIWSGQLMRPIYIGRKSAASPATGLLSRHIKEQNDIMTEAFRI